MAAKVLQFAREATESPLAKKLREIQRANDAFWSTPGPNVVQVGYAVAQMLKTKQKARAKKPRPQRKEKHAARDQRIRAASAKGTAPKKIAADESLTASQVRKILNLKN